MYKFTSRCQIFIHFHVIMAEFDEFQPRYLRGKRIHFRSRSSWAHALASHTKGVKMVLAATLLMLAMKGHCQEDTITTRQQLSICLRMRMSAIYRFDINKSPLVGKPTMWFPNRPDTNRAAHSQKTPRSLKFQI